MSKLYHFGDSYSDIIQNSKVKHFGNIISDTIGYEYKSIAFSGHSNEQILNTIINNIIHFEKGDILFVNFSFFPRGCWYDKKSDKIKSTNIFYDELSSTKLFELAGENEKVLSLIGYYLDHTEDYASRLFTLIDSTLKCIELLGIKVFYIFVDDAKFSDRLIKTGTNIKFKNGFAKWLWEYGFHREEEGHYTAGIQNMLADAILKKTNNFDKSIGKSVEISIDDIDLSLIVKPNKLSLLL